ncbi:MAG: MFS transporter, partial [Duganella sp.]
LVLGSVGPLLVDRGVSLEQLAYLGGAGGAAAGLAGTALGGLLVRQAGAWRALQAAIGLQALLLAALAATAAAAPPAWLQALAVLLYLALAAGFVAVYSLLMDCTSPHQAGLDFTIFQCADALVAVLAGVAGGWLSQRLGYGASFALAAAWTFCAVLFLFLRPARTTLTYNGVST